MENSTMSYCVPQVLEHDGYAGKKIWKKKKNSSMYYDYNVDKQYTVPITSPSELEEKYGLNKKDDKSTE